MKEYIKTCKLCKRLFVAHSKRAEVCPNRHTSYCIVCGKEYELKPPYITKTCSRKCGQKQGNISRRKTSLDRYGTDNPAQSEIVKQRTRENNLKKWGYDNPSKSPVIKDKIKSTFLRNYNVDNPMKVPEIAEKLKHRCLDTYGGLGLQSPIIRSKVESTNLEKYGYENPLGNPEIRKKILDERESRTGYRYCSSDPNVKAAISKACQEKYGVLWNCMRPECRNASNVISKVNQHFASVLDQHNIVYEMEYPIHRFVYDFYLPNHQVVIEINPTITHNSYFSIYGDSNIIAPDYHSNKTHTAHLVGLKCIHVWDWDDISRIVSILGSKVKIGARNCELRPILKTEAEKFTSKYHLSGSCRGQIVCYGLFFQNQLVQVMTFGKPRYNHNYDFELLRLCTDTNYQIVGGASKLFKQFLLDHPNSTVISYCDRSKFSGNVYDNIGMKYHDTTPSNKIWSKGSEYITQNLLNQRGYDQLFDTNYGKGTSNTDLMLQSGWLPVYDCGQYVFTYGS